jgi:hypothetical protein
VTNTDDRPDRSSEGAPDIDKTVNVKQKLRGSIPRRTDRLIIGHKVNLTLTDQGLVQELVEPSPWTATLTWWEGLCLFDVKKADQRQSEIK